MNGPLQPEDLQRFCPEAVKFIEGLNDACVLAEINTPRRIRYFLAQLAEESRGFTKTHESFDYTPEALLEFFGRHLTADQAHTLGRHPGERFVPVDRQAQIANLVYANRMGNGGMASGDGSRFRGRTLIEVTGRDNYTACERALHAGILETPEILEQPYYAAYAAGWYWKAGEDQNLNAFADAGDFEGLTKKVNGGLNGFDARKAWLDKAVLIWPEAE